MNYIINNQKFINSIDRGIKIISDDTSIDIIEIPSLILLIISCYNQHCESYTIEDLSILINFVIQNHCSISSEQEKIIKDTVDKILACISIIKITEHKTKCCF
jgi:hypothetical protein